jgi:hypothetical protein
VIVSEELDRAENGVGWGGGRRDGEEEDETEKAKIGSSSEILG